jgi:hypothetical protein
LISKTIILKKQQALLWTLLFFILGMVMISRHEMWRDEMQHWKIVTDSSSPADIVRNLKYEGHPFLWHLFLFPFSRLSSSPFMLQIVHLLLATLAAFIFLKYSPFSGLQKSLFVFGYFPFYEYSVIARNYVLGFLLLFLFCSLFPRRQRNFIWLALLLALSANTNVYALILVISISLGMAVDILRSKHQYQFKKVVLGYAIILLGIAVSVATMVPPPDSGNVVSWTTHWDPQLLKKVAATPMLAAFPIPSLNRHFWNSNLLVDLGLPPAAQIGLAFLIVLFGIFLLRRKPAVLLIYVTGTLGFLSFFYLKYYGYLRHHGFLFLLMVISYWLYLRWPAQSESVAPAPRRSRPAKALNGILTAILAVQLMAGLAAGTLDCVLTFSQGKIAARFIKLHGLDNLPAVGDIDFACTTISGYLNTKIYYPRGHRWGSFVIWDKIRTAPMSEYAILETARRLSLRRKQNCLVITNAPLTGTWLAFTVLKAIGRTNEAAVEDESYYFYLLPYTGRLADSINAQLIPFIQNGH